jgi:hypothetical protein
VLRALEARLRLELAAVSREGNRITVVGLGPTRRANQHNRTVIDVSAGVDGSIVDADVYYHPAFLIKHARQEEMMRLRFDEIFGGMKDLLASEPRPETASENAAHAAPRPVEREPEPDDEEGFHIEEYLRNAPGSAARKGRATRIAQIKDAVRRKTRPAEAGAAPVKKTRESSSARVRATRGTRQRHGAEAGPAKTTRIDELKPPAAAQVPPTGIHIAARLEEAVQLPRAVSAEPAREPVIAVTPQRSGIAAAALPMQAPMAAAPARVIPLVPAPLVVAPSVPAPLVAAVQAVAAAAPIVPITPAATPASPPVPVEASATVDVPSLVAASTVAAAAPAIPSPVPPHPALVADQPPSAVSQPAVAAHPPAQQAPAASTPQLHYALHYSEDERFDDDAEQQGGIRRWVLWGALAASVAATVSLGVHSWSSQQQIRTIAPVGPRAVAAEDSAAGSVAPSAPTGDPSDLLRQWETAMRSTDAKEQASFYAVPAERYLSHSNATKEQIVADKQSEITSRRDGWAVAIEQVKIARPSDTTATARLVKHYTGRDGGSSVSERFVLTELRLRNEYGIWWITSERDLGWAGSRERLEHLATSSSSAP